MKTADEPRQQLREMWQSKNNATYSGGDEGTLLLLFLCTRSDALPAIPPEGQRQEVSDCFLCTGPELALSTQQLSSPDRREVAGSEEALWLAYCSCADQGKNVLYQGFPVVFKAGGQLLHDFPAAAYVRSPSIWNWVVMGDNSRLLVEVQKVWDSIFWQLPSGAENKYVLDPVAL